LVDAGGRYSDVAFAATFVADADRILPESQTVSSQRRFVAFRSLHDDDRAAPAGSGTGPKLVHESGEERK
jgi:hypothetical protein